MRWVCELVCLYPILVFFVFFVVNSLACSRQY
jgi:hypothetical protein